jgi:hypothetical protein
LLNLAVLESLWVFNYHFILDFVMLWLVLTFLHHVLIFDICFVFGLFGTSTDDATFIDFELSIVELSNGLLLYEIFILDFGDGP